MCLTLPAIFYPHCRFIQLWYFNSNGLAYACCFVQRFLPEPDASRSPHSSSSKPNRSLSPPSPDLSVFTIRPFLPSDEVKSSCNVLYFKFLMLHGFKVLCHTHIAMKYWFDTILLGSVVMQLLGAAHTFSIVVGFRCYLVCDIFFGPKRPLPR